MSDYVKDVLGKEDIALDTARNNATFSRGTSSGGSQTITKLNAKHIPVTNALSWDGATTVEEFLTKAKAFKDEYDAFVANVGYWDKYLGPFVDSATLIATHSAPSSDDVFAYVRATKSFWFWDEALGTPAWADYNEQIYDRTNHTGEQAISTITGLQTALDALAVLDGDILDITFNPSNYIPNYSGTAASDNDDLAAHLNGIDANMRLNYYGSSNPAVTDDSDDGYSVGSLGFNTTTGAVFKCTDATVGAAVWSNLADTVETLIHTEEITSSVANVEIDISSLSPSYRRLRVEIEGVKLAGITSTYAQMFMEINTNGAWRTTDYMATCQYQNRSADGVTGSTAKAVIGYGAHGLDEEFDADFTINNLDGDVRKGYGSWCAYDSGSVEYVGGVMNFSYDGTDNTEIIDELRFSGTHNLTGGKIRIYGVND